MFVGQLAPVKPRINEDTKLVAWPTPYGPGDCIGDGELLIAKFKLLVALSCEKLTTIISLDPPTARETVSQSSIPFRKKKKCKIIGMVLITTEIC